jgi:hypothetical protein
MQNNQPIQLMQPMPMNAKMAMPPGAGMAMPPGAGMPMPPGPGIVYLYYLSTNTNEQFYLVYSYYLQAMTVTWMNRPESVPG